MEEEIKVSNDFTFIEELLPGNSVEEIENAVLELIEELILRNNLNSKTY